MLTKILKETTISQKEIDKLQIFEYLRKEGMEISETIKVQTRMEQIYNEMFTQNHPYSIHQISLILIHLLDDDYFDDEFVEKMFCEAYDKTSSFKKMHPHLESYKKV